MITIYTIFITSTACNTTAD